MDFQLSDYQQMIVTATERVVQERIAPIMREHPVDRPLPKPAMLEIYALLAELGITAPRLPVEAGGGGFKMVDYGLMLERLPPVVALSLISHEGTVARIHSSCSEELRALYLSDLIAGRKIACTATTEAQAGSESAAIRTRLTVSGDYAFLTGRKMWITNGSIADLLNVSCVTVGFDSSGKPVGRRVLVDSHVSQFEVRETAVTGLQQGHLSELVFESTKVAASHIIGVAGDTGRTLTVGWNGNRPLLGLMCVHLAQAAFQMVLPHVHSRVQFGKPLSSHQLVQQDLADIETAITTSRLVCYHALDRLDRGLRANGAAAMAKRYATQACERAVNLAMQVYGAMGLSQELGLERIWRDTRMLQVPDGTNGILALIQGRELTGSAAFH